MYVSTRVGKNFLCFSLELRVDRYVYIHIYEFLFAAGHFTNTSRKLPLMRQKLKKLNMRIERYARM